ncbi:MAG: glycosyltransferase family 4 protein [Anaerolineae bacterium]|nr:glycosyltransferase family 4 protein [Anaerolineae bacterium]
MRVLYYAVPWFLDVEAPFIAAMSRLVDLHVLLEINPMAWRTSMFDVSSIPVASGVSQAEAVLQALPGRLTESWGQVQDFRLAVYPGKRAYDPRNLQTGRAVLGHVRAVAPDVVHLEGYSGRLTWVLPALARRPLVVSVHDPRPHLGESHWRKTIVRRLSFAAADRLVLHNRAQVADFRDEYRVPESKVEVIPLGVCDAFASWGVGNAGDGSGEEEGTVLFYGRLSPYKGLEDLYRAAELVCRQMPTARFIVAGQPVPGYDLPPAPDLPGNALELHLGYVPNDELIALMRRSCLVVCPYTEATQSAVVLTAYAFNKPVVATEVGGLPEYVRHGETGLLVPPRDPEALAAAIIRVLAGAERHKFRLGIRALAEGELSWTGIAERTAEAYCRMLGGIQ